MIKIYYCNWDSKDEKLKSELIPALLGCEFKFNMKNYRLINECNIKYKDPSYSELEMLIADIDAGDEKSAVKFFNDTLNTIWEKYNDNPNHKFRSMCVGDVIQFSSKYYHIRFRVDMAGFKLLK